MKKAKLFYFPYAGASSATYRSWGNKFDESIEFTVLDYPGHGRRNSESFCRSAADISRALLPVIAQSVADGTPYFFAGHCLGALIGFSLCQMIDLSKELPMPSGLIISGHGAPDKVVIEGLYKMNDTELIEYQKKVGGIPEELLEDDYIDYVKEIVLPPIRYDSEAYESFKVSDTNPVLPIPLTVINGLKDWKSPQDEVKRWSSFSSKEVRFVNYDEDHYFINSMTKAYIEEMTKTIRNILDLCES